VLANGKPRINYTVYNEEDYRNYPPPSCGTPHAFTKRTSRRSLLLLNSSLWRIASRTDKGIQHLVFPFW
jgi:hypothetical protein